MRRLGVLGLFLAVTLGLAASAQAGVVSTMLAGNATNDQLTDYSWSAKVYDAEEGDVVVGLARIDKIVTSAGKTEGLDTVYIAFAFQVTGTVGSEDPYASQFTGWLKHDAPTVEDYQLSTLLGDDIPSNAMMAIVELKDSPASDSNLSKLVDGSYASKETILGAFDDIENADHSWIGAFGIEEGSDDFLYISPFNYGIAVEVFGLSLLAPGPGLNEEDYKPLYAIDDRFDIDETKYQLASNDTLTVEHKSGTTEYKDRGITAVNYVPEPVSLIGLASLALTAGGLGLIRRRKSA